MVAPIDAMDETGEASLELRLSLVGYGQGRARAEHAERAVDALSSRNGIAKREACAHQRYDFLVVGVFIPVYEIDRVATTRRCSVAGREQGIEALADCVHVARVLAILPSAPQ